jgi:hypothetical protein
VEKSRSQKTEDKMSNSEASMSEQFEPRNDLERHLLAAQEGEVSDDAFMQKLMASQVFMPVQDEATAIANFQRSDKAVPLMLESEEGGQVVILFTSPERAKPFLKDFPGYGGGLLTEFTWVLERTGSGVGISLNPGWPVGIDMEPQMVAQLAGRKG